MNAEYRALYLRRIGTLTCKQEKIRRGLQMAPTLMRTLQSCRALVHYGPWRHAARAMIRIARPPQAETGRWREYPLQFDCPRVLESLRTDGNAVAGILSPDILRRLRQATVSLPPGEYADLDDIPDVRLLVQCSAVMEVVRGYLRAEPELLECNLVVAQAEDPHKPLPYDSQRRFHFDYAGWHSLNLFTYLSDVSQDSGAHQVVIGTHRSRKAWDAIRGAVPDDEIQQRYPNRLRTIAGPAGTMFFEDTSAFHRRQIHTKRRVMLNFLYASHRSWLSKGRLVPKYSDFFRRHEVVSTPE
jgi:hypothetical protein